MNIYLTLSWIFMHILISESAPPKSPGSLYIKVKNDVVSEQGNVSLVCVTTSLTGRIKWFLNNKRFAVTRRQKPNSCSVSRSTRNLSVVCRGTVVTLVLKNVTLRDTGNWHCEDPGNKKESKTLKLNVLPQTTTSPPTTVTTPNKEENAIIRETPSPSDSDLPSSVVIYVEKAKVVTGVTPMLLTCTSYCDTTFTFSWDHGNVTGNISKVVRSNGVCSQSLTLWVTWQHDQHQITCMVQNPATSKSISENATLNLYYMPLDPIISITPSGSIQEGDIVNITCTPRIAGKPRGRTTVVLRAGIDRGRTATNYVNFTVSRDDDGAEVKCVAVNIHTAGNHSFYTSTRYLDVLYSPKLTVTRNVTTSEDGSQSVTLTCSASGNPNNVTFSKWRHMNGRLTVRELPGDDSPTQSVLRMTSLGYADNGIYICNGTNGVGRNGSTYNFHWADVVVQGLPYFPDANSEDVTVVPTLPNTTLTLTFRYVSNPNALVTWYLDGLVLNTSLAGLETGSSQEKVKVNLYGLAGYKQGHEERLLFDSVTSDNDGDYYVRACNVYGCRNSSVIRLRVSDKGVSGVISPDDSSPSMGMIIGVCAASAILLIIIIIIIALLVQRKKCGYSHYTTDEMEDHDKNGVSIVKGEVCVYSTLRDEEARRTHSENGRGYQGKTDMEQESVMVIVRSGKCENSMRLEPPVVNDAPEDMGPGVDLSVENLNTDLQEEPQVKDDDLPEEPEVKDDDNEVSEETKKIVTEIYSQVQKPRSSAMSDDVTNDVIEDPDDGDAFEEEDSNENLEKTDDDGDDS